MPSATLPRPIAVTDAQMSAIMTAAAPLQPFERVAFLTAVAHRLRSEPEPVGDGTLNRLIREVVREVWRPPTTTGDEPRHNSRIGEPIA
jgi:hypothetical protein